PSGSSGAALLSYTIRTITKHYPRPHLIDRSEPHPARAATPPAQPPAAATCHSHGPSPAPQPPPPPPPTRPTPQARHDDKPHSPGPTQRSVQPPAAPPQNP